MTITVICQQLSFTVSKWPFRGNFHAHYFNWKHSTHVTNDSYCWIMTITALLLPASTWQLINSCCKSVRPHDMAWVWYFWSLKLIAGQSWPLSREISGFNFIFDKGKLTTKKNSYAFQFCDHIIFFFNKYLFM